MYQQPVQIDVEIKPIEVGQTYRLNDIYFATASYELTAESRLIVDGFIGSSNETVIELLIETSKSLLAGEMPVMPGGSISFLSRTGQI